MPFSAVSTLSIPTVGLKWQLGPCHCPGPSGDASHSAAGANASSFGKKWPVRVICLPPSMDATEGSGCGSPARGSVENLLSPWNGYSRAKNRPAEQKRERFRAPSPDRSQESNLRSGIRGEHHRLRLLMVLSKLDFRVASGQFASAGISRNPDLPKEIVAAHALENET